MNNENLESIWADGVPTKINKDDILMPLDILKLCMRFTVEHILVPNDYKIVGLREDLNNFPHITAEKEGKTYGIVVLPEIFPHFGAVPTDFRMQYVEACGKHNVVPVLCPILIHSQDKERAEKSILLKGDVFRLANIGQLILTDEETQEINPQTLTFKL